MKKPKEIRIGSLRDYTYLQILDIAYRISKINHGLTYEEIAEQMGKGRETIHRYFTDPQYNPPTCLVPRLCQVLGNYLLIDWLCAQVDGHLTFVECRTDPRDLISRMGELTKEFSDVLREDGKAREDGDYTPLELAEIERELGHLVSKAEQTLRDVKAMRDVMKQDRGRQG